MNANIIRFTVLVGLLIVGFMSGWKLAGGLWVGWLIVNYGIIWSQKRKAFNQNKAIVDVFLRSQYQKKKE